MQKYFRKSNGPKSMWRIVSNNGQRKGVWAHLARKKNSENSIKTKTARYQTDSVRTCFCVYESRKCDWDEVKKKKMNIRRKKNERERLIFKGYLKKIALALGSSNNNVMRKPAVK